MIQVTLVKFYHNEENLNLKLFVDGQFIHFKRKISYYEAKIRDFYRCNFSASIN
jgi:hypothetical protein